VYISTLSVFRDPTARMLDEAVPPDALDPYGLTKRLGEEVCRAASADWGLPVTVLRLAWPTPDDAWPAWARHDTGTRISAPDGTPIDATAASDVASAVCAALERPNGYQVFTIAGDDRLWSTDKARRLLGWRPRFARDGG
jgi:nucleoside-diphosphate-sugar epimerase